MPVGDDDAVDDKLLSVMSVTFYSITVATTYTYNLYLFCPKRVQFP
jgi:hypothetical protein